MLYNPTSALKHVPIWAEARMRRSRQAVVGRSGANLKINF